MIVEFEIEQNNQEQDIFIEFLFLKMIIIKKLFKSFKEADWEYILLDCFAGIWTIHFHVFYFILSELFFSNYSIKSLSEKYPSITLKYLFESSTEIFMKVLIKFLMVNKKKLCSFSLDLWGIIFIFKILLRYWNGILFDQFEWFADNITRIPKSCIILYFEHIFPQALLKHHLWVPIT